MSYGDVLLLRAITSGFSNYANFQGRASRSMFWYWIVFFSLMNFPTALIDFFIGYPLTTNLTQLGLLLPTIAVSARRLHDIDRTGWWVLLYFPVISSGVLPSGFSYLVLVSSFCSLVLFWWFCLRGTDGPNRYGPPDRLAS